MKSEGLREAAATGLRGAVFEEGQHASVEAVLQADLERLAARAARSVALAEPRESKAKGARPFSDDLAYDVLLSHDGPLPGDRKGLVRWPDAQGAPQLRGSTLPRS